LSILNVAQKLKRCYDEIAPIASPEAIPA
jgi:hypothetical protein